MIIRTPSGPSGAPYHTITLQSPTFLYPPPTKLPLLLGLWLTLGCANAITFTVNDASHFGEVAVAAGDVVYGGGLHEQGVVGLQDPLDAVLDRLDQRSALPTAHKGPHLLKSGHPGPLWWTRFQT